MRGGSYLETGRWGWCLRTVERLADVIAPEEGSRMPDQTGKKHMVRRPILRTRYVGTEHDSLERLSFARCNCVHRNSDGGKFFGFQIVLVFADGPDEGFVATRYRLPRLQSSVSHDHLEHIECEVVRRLGLEVRHHLYSSSDSKEDASYQRHGTRDLYQTSHLYSHLHASLPSTFS